MKLFNDFGVRALLATIGGIGFYTVLGFVIVKYPLDLTSILAIVSIAQAPWMTALAFYFAKKSGETPK